MLENKKENFKNWFPGHMKKARFLIKKNLNNVDVVYEVIDARAPLSTRNVKISNIIKNKITFLILAKADLADFSVTRLWVKKLQEEKLFSFAVDCRNFKQTRKIVDMSYKILKDHKKSVGKKNLMGEKFRAMVVGVPNVGKSSLINCLAGKKKAKTGNFPGVTRSEQWISLNENISLLDTPGNLDFNIENEKSFFALQLLGSIKTGLFDVEHVALNMINFLKDNNAKFLRKQIKADISNSAEVLLEQFAKNKCFIKKKGEPDLNRAAGFLVKQFSANKLKGISLEVPNEWKFKTNMLKNLYKGKFCGTF